MKAVLISIRPKWVELIASGKKTIEVRKTRPKLETPFKCYIYETHDTKYENIGIYDPDARLYKNFIHHPGKVIGEFVCDTMVKDNTCGRDNLFNGAACIAQVTATAYASGKPLYGWHISALKIYDEPKKLSEFEKACDHENDCCTCKRFSVNYACINSISRPPQSYMYVEEMTT